jgi:hypothetical protein
VLTAVARRKTSAQTGYAFPLPLTLGSLVHESGVLDR